MDDFRMWIFEQNSNLYSNKFDVVSKNLVSMLQNEKLLNLKMTDEEKEKLIADT